MSNMDSSEDLLNVVDLDKQFLKHAKHFFQDAMKNRLEKILKTNLIWEDLTKTLDYSNFLMDTENYDYHRVKPMKQSNHVVFKTTYENTTSTPLKYTLNVERTTRNITTMRLNKGLNHSGNVGLKLKLPLDIGELEGGYSREFTMQKERETSREEEIVWSANTEIQVPPKTDTTMELVVEEHEYDGTFNCIVRLSGQVSVIVYKGERQICRIDQEEFCEILTPSLGFSFDEKTKTVCYKISGVCNCRKGLQQSIKLSERPHGVDSIKKGGF